MDPMKDLPMGFGMALMQNEAAFQKFSEMPETQQKKVLEQTHSIKSKEEMKSFVNGLSGAF